MSLSPHGAPPPDALEETPAFASMFDGRVHEPLLATLLRALAHAVFIAILVLPITVPLAVGLSSFSALAAAVVASFLARSALRLAVQLLLVGLCLCVTLLVHSVFVGPLSTALDLGPETVLKSAESILFAGCAFSLVLALRLLALRYRVLRVLEAMVGVAAFGLLLMAHRHGAINRPFALADPLIARGQDPMWLFAAAGLVCAFFVVILLLEEVRVTRALSTLFLLVVGLLAAAAGLDAFSVPHNAKRPDPLGLNGEQPKQSKSDDQGGQNNRQESELEFKDEFNPKQEPMGVVIFHTDYSPPYGYYYFRQAAFSQYNGRRLVQATGLSVDQDVIPRFPAGAPVEVPGTVPGASGFGAERASVEHTVALLVEHAKPFALETPEKIESVKNPDPRRFLRLYRAHSQSLDVDFFSLRGREVGDVNWDEKVLAHYTDAPSDPRYQTLANKIVEQMLVPEVRKDPLARAGAVIQWLSNEGTYSTKTKHATATDPTASFLFGDLVGYCVHFAHAAVFLMRTLGVPARVATGYAIPEANRRGGSALLVMGSDSHAWPEVHIEGLGWVILDVSPESVLTPPPPPPDADLQQLLAELMRGQGLTAGQSEPPASVEEMALITLSRLLAGAASILALILLALAVLKWGRRWQPIVASNEDLPIVLYRASLDLLSEVDERRARGETREAFARRIATRYPSFAVLTEANVAHAFGGAQTRTRFQHARDLQPERLHACLRGLRKERRAQVPWYRRLWGALVPWTWLSSR